jgi:hypothetical protein
VLQVGKPGSAILLPFEAYYLDFSPFSRSVYVVDIDTSKQQRLSFPRKIVASLCTNGFSTHACKEAALSTIKETAKSRL